MSDFKEESLTAETLNNGEPAENGDLSKLYEDDLQESVVTLQKAADHHTERYHEHPYGAADIITDIVSFIISVGVAFAWTLVMLLIMSFVLRSACHLKIEGMLAVSGAVSLAVAIFTAVRKADKYIKLNDEKRRFKKSREDKNQSNTL